MTEGQLHDLERMVEVHLVSWRWHQDYDDLRQECWVAAWRAVEAKTGDWAFTTLAYKAIEWARREFLRSPRATRRFRRNGEQDPAPVSLSLSHEDDQGDVIDSPEPLMDDFVPELIDRLDAVALCRALLAEEGAGVRRLIAARYHGATYKEIGAACGKSEAQACFVHLQFLNRCRVALGLPQQGGEQARWPRPKRGQPFAAPADRGDE